MPAHLRITIKTTIHKTQPLQDKFKETCQLYIETVDVEKVLTKKIVATIEKKYLLAIYNKIIKKITNNVLKVIQHLLKNYGKVQQITIN